MWPAAIGALVLGASFALTPETLPPWVLCPMMAIVELPCPGCGMTRAFTCIAHGRFAEAWEHNALAFPAFAGAVALLSRNARQHLGRAIGPRAAVLIFALGWVWNFWRI